MKVLHLNEVESCYNISFDRENIQVEIIIRLVEMYLMVLWYQENLTCIECRKLQLKLYKSMLKLSNNKNN